jgi:hypothetical protein
VPVAQLNGPANERVEHRVADGGVVKRIEQSNAIEIVRPLTLRMVANEAVIGF